jgi:hypothetical protein
MNESYETLQYEGTDNEKANTYAIISRSGASSGAERLQPVWAATGTHLHQQCLDSLARAYTGLIHGLTGQDGIPGHCRRDDKTAGSGNGSREYCKAQINRTVCGTNANRRRVLHSFLSMPDPTPENHLEMRNIRHIPCSNC